jgi:hypothetical protein
VIEECSDDTTGNEFKIFSIPEGWQNNHSEKSMIINTKITEQNYRTDSIPATLAGVDKCGI